MTVDDIVPEGFYDIVIDKGCTDCLMTEPGKNGGINMTKAMKEIYKTMKEHAVLYMISTAKPEKRISYLTSVGTSVSVDIDTISKIIKLNDNYIAAVETDDKFLNIYNEFNESDNMYYMYVVKKT
jgi:hypothetical protein